MQFAYFIFDPTVVRNLRLQWTCAYCIYYFGHDCTHSACLIDSLLPPVRMHLPVTIFGTRRMTNDDDDNDNVATPTMTQCCTVSQWKRIWFTFVVSKVRQWQRNILCDVVWAKRPQEEEIKTTKKKKKEGIKKRHAMRASALIVAGVVSHSCRCSLPLPLPLSFSGLS